jgi:hypothetical protein
VFVDIVTVGRGDGRQAVPLREEGAAVGGAVRA